MPSICLLPDQLISQIAAGEVIERPAAVVKELLENAIDAGANQISIRLKNGGIKRILINDNGKGIPSNELKLALTRHATSKIASLHDLEHVATLGFRGEALASIASVAHVEITSKTASDKHAWKINGNRLNEAPKPASGPTGTTVDVNELYINTPARRKFLKTEPTEYGHCLNVVERIALARPDIEFNLSHNDKNPLRWPKGTLKERAAAILGKEFENASLFIDQEAGSPPNALRLYGYIGLPTASKNKADDQYFYVNGRYVRDRLLTHAVRAAYEDVLYNNQYPSYVLFLEIDPTLVDVNVHPTKMEIQFRDGRGIHQYIFHTISRALKQTNPSESTPQLASPVKANWKSYSSPSQNRVIQDPKTYGQFFANTLKEAPQQENLSFFKEQTTTEAIKEEHPLGYALAQIKDTLILAQNQYGLVLVDMHAAHERILYEELKAQLDAKALQTQSLLVPISFKVDPIQAGTIQEHQDFLLEWGFDITLLSPEIVAIRSVPFLLKNANVEALIKDVLNDLHQYGTSALVLEKRNEILATICCHKAVRANHHLSISEMNALLRKMETTDNANQCNHGRPTWVQIGWQELDGFFMRGK